DARVERAFDGQIVRACRGRKYLTDPIRGELDRSLARQRRQSIAPPTREFRRKLGRAGDGNPGFNEDPPSAWATAAALKGAVEIARYSRFYIRMHRPWARKGVEF